MQLSLNTQNTAPSFNRGSFHLLWSKPISNPTRKNVSFKEMGQQVKTRAATTNDQDLHGGRKLESCKLNLDLPYRLCPR